MGRLRTSSRQPFANHILSSRVASPRPAITSDITPSALALSEVIRQLTAMRENDNRKDMSEDRVELYKNPITTSLDQAVTYESFLER